MVSSKTFREELTRLQMKHLPKDFFKLHELHPDVIYMQQLAESMHEDEDELRMTEYMWDPEEEAYLKEQYQSQTLVEISDELDLPYHIVKRKAARLFPRRKRNKTVRMMDADRNILGEWKSVVKASKATGVTNNVIYKACKNKKPYKGIIWEYVEEGADA